MTTATLTAPRTVRSRNPLWALTGYEIRRLVRNPLFLVVVGFNAYAIYDTTSRVIF